jgi:chromosome segregation ATPase
VTHPQRRAMDEIDIGELVRNLAALTSAVERINDKLDNLSTQFTPREVHDLALGGLKIDIRRLDEERATTAREWREAVNELDDRQDDHERKTAERFAAADVEVARRFRQAVLVAITSLLAPLTIGIVLLVLTSLPGGGA